MKMKLLSVSVLTVDKLGIMSEAFEKQILTSKRLLQQKSS